ncbi:MAG TPA: hypothetical protein VL346_09625 [Acidobacteriaceae bacterium]|jgi:hypothetical protein|nr:hypothetical protein [Acidobacteriaceae bacterium]
MITAHNSSYTVRGLGQVSKPVSLEIGSLESIHTGRRMWFPDFN